MIKNYLLLFSLILAISAVSAQQLVLKKGVVIDSLVVNDSIPQETFSLFLPTSFETNKKWPILMLLDLKGNERKGLSLFLAAAEAEGFVLAAPNNLSDSLSLSKNMLHLGNSLNKIYTLLPIDKERIYTTGFDTGAQFASLAPLFIKGVDGVVAIGAGLPNVELLSTKNRFQFIGLVAREDFSFRDLIQSRKVLNQLKFDNQLILFDAENKLPRQVHLEQAMKWLKLSSVAKGSLPKDSVFVQNALKLDGEKVAKLVDIKKFLLAEHLLGEMHRVYRHHINTDSIRSVRKSLRKRKDYKNQKRSQNSIFFKENLLREDYQYYLEEDVLTYNFNNLGWWNYQMQELNKFLNSKNFFERQMGSRLIHYINTLAEDDINSLKAEEKIDEDALTFLWMLKTITDPKNADYYLKVVSVSAKNEDFGTALFYLEELLKTGFKDKERLYQLEHTALFRITPEFNNTVSKYLKDARYEVIEE